MAPSLSRSRRLSTAARWPLGVGLTSWRYLWRTSPLCRRESAGDPAADAPPDLPPGFEDGEVQLPSEGIGPLFHRRYRVRVVGAELSPAGLLTRMRADLDAFAPLGLASFQTVIEGRPLETGDDCVVRMPGPWDGPVRVVETTESSLRLATLAGHLEAGQIELRAQADGELVFTIESWARSGDRLSNLLYSRARMAKEVQLHVWVSFLERVVEVAGGRRSGCIEIETRRVDDPGRGRRW